MSAIIYEKTANGLYPTGERSVSTYSSGLVRVDQTFFCRTSAAPTHRATLAAGNSMPGSSAPAMDGLYIFPKPQEFARDDGFTEFIVSSYGRTTDSPYRTYEWRIFQEPGVFVTNEGTELEEREQVIAIYRNREAKVQIVRPTSTIAAGNQSFYEDTLGAELPQKISGRIGNQNLFIWQLGLTSLETKNYGFFSEITYVIGVFKVSSET